MEAHKVIVGSILALLVIILVILVIMGYNNMKYRSLKQTGYGKAKGAWQTAHPAATTTPDDASS